MFSDLESENISQSSQFRSLFADLHSVVGGRATRACLERLFQRHRTVMLLQEVSKGLVRELLKILHAVARQALERLKGLAIERNQFAPFRVGSLGRPFS